MLCFECDKRSERGTATPGASYGDELRHAKTGADFADLISQRFPVLFVHIFLLTVELEHDSPRIARICHGHDDIGETDSWRGCSGTRSRILASRTFVETTAAAVPTM